MEAIQEHACLLINCQINGKDDQLAEKLLEHMSNGNSAL